MQDTKMAWKYRDINIKLYSLNTGKIHIFLKSVSMVYT